MCIIFYPFTPNYYPLLLFHLNKSDNMPALSKELP